MFAATTWCCLSTLLLSWQTAPAPAAAPPPASRLTTEEEIQRAIAQLGNDRIAVREQASQQLWEAGAAAEPALKVAATSTDAETRLRARAILDRFRFGMFADTPPEVVELIHRFRNGDTERRSQVLLRITELREFATLFRLLQAESDTSLRTALLERLLQDPQGVAGRLIQLGLWKEVEQLLEAGATQDVGMLAIAAHYQVRGELAARIERARRDQAANPAATTARLLAYLLRAQGDLPGALEAARAADDRTLDRALLLESGRWADLLRLEKDIGPRLPVPLNVNAGNVPAVVERVEQLGYALAAALRAGLDEEVNRLVDELKKLAQDSAENPSLQWNVAEALLIGERSSDGIAVLKTVQPLAAFELLTYRHQYREAWEFVQLDIDRPIAADWLDKLPAANAGEKLQKQYRIRLALAVARVLHFLGRKKTALEVINVVDRAVQDAGGKERGASGRVDLLLQLAQAELRTGSLEAAFAHADQSVGEGGNESQALRALFGTRLEEATAWYVLLRSKEPANTFGKLVPKIYRLMQSPGPNAATAEELDEWVAPGLDHAMTMGQLDQRARFIESLAATLTARQRLDAAARLLASTAEIRGSSSLRLADLEAERQRWPEAARWYGLTAKLDPSQVGGLFLQGLALEKSGEAAEGAKLQQMARLLALNSRSRHAIGQLLQQRGHREKAEQVLEWAMRTSPCEHWETNDAARLLGEVLEDSDPEKTATLWDRHMLADLRVIYNFLEVESYLRFPFLIHKQRARAAAARGDVAGALAEGRRAWEVSPGDVRLAEDVVPLLDKAGRQAEAEILFEQTFTALSAVLDKYPDSAFHRNNLAWVSARCHRRLDVALEHARRAVELSPTTASYTDTLAEVHFHRGDRDEAIRLARRAIELSPRYKPFQEQLERFQRAPLPQ